MAKFNNPLILLDDYRSLLSSDKKDDFMEIIKDDNTYEVLLSEYYQQEIKVKFTINGKDEEKCFTINMIPSEKDRKENWIDDYFDIIKIKLDNAGYTNISFEKIGKEIKMPDSKIDYYLKYGSTYNLDNIISGLVKKYTKDWNMDVVMTTHSPKKII